MTSARRSTATKLTLSTIRPLCPNRRDEGTWGFLLSAICGLCEAARRKPSYDQGLTPLTPIGFTPWHAQLIARRELPVNALVSPMSWVQFVAVPVPPEKSTL